MYPFIEMVISNKAVAVTSPKREKCDMSASIRHPFIEMVG